MTIVPTNLIKNDKDLINDRNSIAILTKSCSKSRCDLEFKMIVDYMENANVFFKDDADNETVNWTWTGKGEYLKYVNQIGSLFVHTNRIDIKIYID